MTHLLTLSDSQYKAEATSELVVLVFFFFLICLAELLSAGREFLTHTSLDAEKITSACHQIMRHVLAFFFFFINSVPLQDPTFLSTWLIHGGEELCCWDCTASWP